jgi:threonine dehydrogenase-like Zn-dependent dehydrogenase
MTDVAATNQRDPEIHQAFLSLACASSASEGSSHFERPEGVATSVIEQPSAAMAALSPHARRYLRYSGSLRSSERGEEAVERVRELTEGLGAHSVLECVGLEQVVETALEIARPGGAVGRVGVPEHDTTPTGVAFWKNASIADDPAPVRAYIEELLPDVLEGRIEPGRVFDRSTNLDGVPDGYRAINEREVIKVIVEL